MLINNEIRRTRDKLKILNTPGSEALINDVIQTSMKYMLDWDTYGFDGVEAVSTVINNIKSSYKKVLEKAESSSYTQLTLIEEDEKD